MVARWQAAFTWVTWEHFAVNHTALQRQPGRRTARQRNIPWEEGRTTADCLPCYAAWALSGIFWVLAGLTKLTSASNLLAIHQRRAKHTAQRGNPQILCTSLGSLNIFFFITANIKRKEDKDVWEKKVEKKNLPPDIFGDSHSFVVFWAWGGLSYLFIVFLSEGK